MRYQDDMVRLLDSVVAERDSLTKLVRDASDPRWIDGSLTNLLEQRLASEQCSRQSNLWLRAETKTIGLDVLFVFEEEQGPFAEPGKQELIIKPVNEDAATLAPTEQIGYVLRAQSFTAVQESFQHMHLVRKRSGIKSLFSKAPNSTQPVPSPGNGNVPSTDEKQAQVGTRTPEITITQDPGNYSKATPSPSNNIPC